MLTVRVSSLVNECKLIKAQSPAFTVCALISAICSFVSSAEYNTSSSFSIFNLPTVVSSAALPTQTRSGLLNSTFSTSAAKRFVFSLTSTFSSVRVSSVSASSVSVPSTFSDWFTSPLLLSAAPMTSRSFSNETKPPPGILNENLFPFTSQWKSTVYTTPYTEKDSAVNSTLEVPSSLISVTFASITSGLVVPSVKCSALTSICLPSASSSA